MQNEPEVIAVPEPKRRRAAKPERGIFEKVPGSGVWWIRYTSQGRYRREKAGTKGMATTLLAKRKTEALQRKKLPETLRRRVVLFDEIGQDALAYSRSHKRSWADDESRMKRLKEWFGNRDAESLNGQEMEARLSDVAADEKWAASTFNHYRSLLMLAYREARRAEKVSSNPARDIRHRKENNERVRFLTRGEDGEYERLLKVIRDDYPEHVAEFTFAIHTGLRLSSQYSATYEMLDLLRNELNVPRTKNDEPIHTPLNTEAMAAIRSLPSWLEGKGPIFRNQKSPRKPVKSNDHWFKPAMKAAKISNFKWHDIRHTFASWLVQEGVPLHRVSELLGHKSLQMTKRYAHLAPNQLHSDVAILVRKSTPVAPEIHRAPQQPVTYMN